ncbi:MAG: bifunctional phosphoribosylaminoimidazolecarboxamide formyltransferase/IMP cyclohydrolase [Clostridiales bacterium]|nr:bifunctional phosphoribosylaminoimidazolecarboxamide formyltransferase/IMP cyclohydrolase [Clostridiales bacterium]
MGKRAIISVSNKSGIANFAKRLCKLGVEILSTGGTANILREEGIKVTNVDDVTGFPECLDGRVKTLHPKIHAGILARRDNMDHMNELKALDIEPIDIVVINLYPFKETILKEGVTLEEAIENIDIGGPTMLRAAAKNFKDVAVVVDPKDYDKVLNELEKTDEISLKTKLYLATKAFEHTAHYDSLIGRYLRDEIGDGGFPDLLTLTYEKAQDMRYGENPHQGAVFYREIGKFKGALTNAKQLHGKALSYNNINDTNGALDLLKEFNDPTIVAVKHANPCGVASSDNVLDAYKKAYESDPVSIFGGIIACNRQIDEDTAIEIDKIFIEIVVAPSYTKGALDVLSRKKNIRILELSDIAIQVEESTWDFKRVYGGLLLQKWNTKLFNEDDDFKVVTKREPTKEELEDLLFAWKVVKHTKSNAITVAKGKKTLGNGPGQVNRIWAAESAIERSGKEVDGAVLASDAFFPFSDVVKAAAEAGITAIIQPGGSIRDKDSIELCDKNDIAMIFTSMRHFKH